LPVAQMGLAKAHSLAAKHASPICAVAPATGLGGAMYITAFA